MIQKSLSREWNRVRPTWLFLFGVERGKENDETQSFDEGSGSVEGFCCCYVICRPTYGFDEFMSLALKHEGGDDDADECDESSYFQVHSWVYFVCALGTPNSFIMLLSFFVVKCDISHIWSKYDLKKYFQLYHKNM